MGGVLWDVSLRVMSPGTGVGPSVHVLEELASQMNGECGLMKATPLQRNRSKGSGDTTILGQVAPTVADSNWSSCCLEAKHLPLRLI